MASNRFVMAIIGALVVTGPVLIGMPHAPRVQAQTSPTAVTSSPSFEVASIKPNRSGDNMTRFMFSPDGFSGNGVTVKMLIGFAYNMKDF